MKLEFSRQQCLPDSSQPRLGWLCTYTPEELLLAAGFAPVRLSYSPCNGTALETPLPANLCGYVRGVLATALTNPPANLVGVVFAMSCDPMRRLADAWETCFPNHFVYRLDVPRRSDQDAEQFFRSELARLRNALGSLQGRPVSDADMEGAIALVNETRRLLGAIAAMRLHPEVRLPGHQVAAIMQAAVETDKKKFNCEVQRFLELSRINKAPAAKGESIPVVLGGCTLAGATGLTAIMEECGLLLAADYLCSGGRIFEGLVAANSDPLRALARRYLRRPGCARMQGAGARVRRIMALARESGARGVVFHTLKFCDPVQSDLPFLRRSCQEERIPLLHLERDYADADSGQLKTRLEAFAELLAARSEENRS